VRARAKIGLQNLVYNLREVGNPGADGHRIKVKALYSFDRSSGRRKSGEKRRSNCKQHPTLCPHAAKSTIVRGVLKKKLAQLGAYPHPMTPDEVTRFAVGQQRTWKPIVEKVAKR
jgi:hypothetical protein